MFGDTGLWVELLVEAHQAVVELRTAPDEGLVFGVGGVEGGDARRLVVAENHLVAVVGDAATGEKQDDEAQYERVAFHHSGVEELLCGTACLADDFFFAIDDTVLHDDAAVAYHGVDSIAVGGVEKIGEGVVVGYECDVI